MHPLEIKERQGPEAQIQRALVSFLRARKWVVKETHGNIYQSGVPDLYIAHKEYRTRWVEVKCPTGYRLTIAQREFFAELASVRVGVWILTAATEVEYMKLFNEANYHHFLEVWKP